MRKPRIYKITVSTSGASTFVVAGGLLSALNAWARSRPDRDKAFDTLETLELIAVGDDAPCNAIIANGEEFYRT